MWMGRTLLLPAVAGVAFIGMLGANASAQAPQARTQLARRVPVIYSTDLFHPHDDPDDHFDLATLFAIGEFDIRAILLDLGERQADRPGRVPLEQMFAMTHRSVPYATGLSSKLGTPQDAGRDRPATEQAAIELILRTLRDSPEPMVMITAGSLRDVAAAFNREPELLRKKIARLYINIGSALAGDEWNVMLDGHAYVTIMNSGLPIYWCPCHPFRDPRSTFWDFDHAKVLDGSPVGLQNFFIYALQMVPPELIDPVEALRMDLRPWRGLVWKMHRQMWCTASFLHAADLQPVAGADGAYAIRPLTQVPAEAKAVFTFVPRRVEIDAAARTRIVDDGVANMQVFQAGDLEQYTRAMTESLAQLFSRFSSAASRPAGG